MVGSRGVKGRIWGISVVAFSVYAREGPGIGQAQADFSWLEEVRGEQAIAWAEGQNAETFARLKSDPRYESIVEQVKDIPSPLARLAPYQLMAGDAYQLLEDTEHPRGLWRRTWFESLRRESPEWETVLDVDALAEAEGVAWKLNALQAGCLVSDYSRCMLGLSDSGSDAVVLREFDMQAREFVDGGFATTTPSRSWTAWVDSESLLIATDVGEGSLTAAMYPRVLRLWKRGQTLDEAETVTEAHPTDLLGTWPMSFSMAGGVRSFVAVIKGILRPSSTPPRRMIACTRAMPGRWWPSFRPWAIRSSITRTPKEGTVPPPRPSRQRSLRPCRRYI